MRTRRRKEGTGAALTEAGEEIVAAAAAAERDILAETAAAAAAGRDILAETAAAAAAGRDILAEIAAAPETGTTAEAAKARDLIAEGLGLNVDLIAEEETTAEITADLAGLMIAKEEEEMVTWIGAVVQKDIDAATEAAAPTDPVGRVHETAADPSPAAWGSARRALREKEMLLVCAQTAFSNNSLSTQCT